MPRSSQQRAISALVDQLGHLDLEIAALKEKQAEASLLRAELVARLGLEATQALSVNGQQFVAQIGEQQMKRKITDMPRLFAILGKRKFVEHCSFPLGALDKLTNPLERKEILEQERNGARSWKTFALHEERSVA
jgi:hypothetical protein